MESCQFLLATWNLCHLPLSIAPDVCDMSQLKRCSYVSLRELILSARSSRRPFSVEFSSVDIVLDKDLESKDVKINLKQWNNIFEKIDPSRVFLFLSLPCGLEFSEQRRQGLESMNQHLREEQLDREDYVSLRSPFILPYAWIPGRDFCLVGVSCHIPSSINA